MFDGNGNWTSDFSAQADRDNGIKILASRFDNIFIADIKESFENCLTKDGQIAPIGNFNMGGQKITNLNTGVNNNDAVNVGQMNNAIATASDSLHSIGDIKASVRGENHGHWFLCNGQAISRETYADLYAIIGTNFGAGDGVTTFNLPDYRGKFLRGLGGDSAANIYTTQAEGLPNITGNFGSGCLMNWQGSTTGGALYRGSNGGGQNAGGTDGGTDGSINLDASRSNGIYGASSHVTPVNQAINYFIKVM
jgi:hypothetical protein